MTDAAQFITSTLPDLFRRGLAALDVRAASGDATAKAIVADIRAASGAGLIHVEGADSYYVAVTAGELSVHTEAPAGVPVRMAIAGPVEGLELFLADSGDEVAADARVAEGVARMASKRAEDLLGAQSIGMHIIIEEVPDLGDVTVRVGLGMDEPPADADFTANVTFDALEEMREKGQNAQQAFMAGKIRLAGNYAPGLSLAMQLAQPPR